MVSGNGSTLEEQIFQDSFEISERKTKRWMDTNQLIQSKILSNINFLQFPSYSLIKIVKSLTLEGFCKLKEFIERLPLIFEENIIFDLIYAYSLSEKELMKVSLNNVTRYSNKFFISFSRKYDEILKIGYDQHDIEIDQKLFDELILLATLKTGANSTRSLFSEQDLKKCLTIINLFLVNIKCNYDSSFMRSRMPSHYPEFYSKLKSFNSDTKDQTYPTIQNNRVLKLIKARIARAIRYSSKRSMEYSIIKLICLEVFVEFDLPPYNINENNLSGLGFSLVKVYSCDSCNLLLKNVASMYQSHYNITSVNLDTNLKLISELTICNGSFSVRELVWNI